MTTQEKKSYQEFIRYSISEDCRIPDSAKTIVWESFYSFCNCHSILGIVYYGIVRSELIVPKRVLFDWCRSVGAIRVMNQNVNECIGKVARLCEKWGYKSCLLKGQANALMYPKPNLRSPGDIDIWLDGDRNEIISRILEDFPKAHYSIHHIKMPLFKKTQVEVHYRPVFLDNWKSDRILQEYIGNIKDSQFAHKEEINGVSIGTLTCEFDVVFQMLHLWHHFFATRNNFKQLIDYYYLLKRGVSQEEKKNSVEMFEKLGVLKYAQGVMWVMQEIFGLEKEYLVVEPDEKVGKLILRETMGFKASSGENISYIKRVFFDNYRFITVFPSEVLVKPFFLLWHQWWKRKMNSSFSTLRKNQVNQEVGCRLCQ